MNAIYDNWKGKKKLKIVIVNYEFGGTHLKNWTPSAYMALGSIIKN